MNKSLLDIQKIEFKKRLMIKCIETIKLRIHLAAAAMANAQMAANSEEKSSAGDKYETSRAMSHLEKDMHSKQLAANRHELAALFNIDCKSLYNQPAIGSFIECGDFFFFIASGLGKIYFEDKMIFVIAPAAPVAKLLLGKKSGDLIMFNNQQTRITSVC